MKLKPYICPACDEGFYLNHAAKKHIVERHPMDVVTHDDTLYMKEEDKALEVRLRRGMCFICVGIGVSCK